MRTYLPACIIVLLGHKLECINDLGIHRVGQLDVVRCSVCNEAYDL
jgi:hypothetical protein